MAFKLPMPPGMKVLVTGGSGVVGRSAVTALIERGHVARLLSRGAATDAKGWRGGVERWPADLTAPASVAGSGNDCDAVLHLVGIVAENGPDETFERVNVGGVRTMLAEATRASVKRFIFVSSLGADRGSSAYHQSKAEAEALVRRFPGEWVIVRPGPVYGPGDEHLSIMLRMIRTLPVLPSIGDGNQRLQPIWHEDLAKALAIAVDHPGVANRVLEIAGPEVITQRGLIDRMRRLTGRHIPSVPVPESVAALGVRALEASGIGSPIAPSQLEMLREENLIGEGKPNALDELGVPATPLDEGLRRLTDDQTVQLPHEGVGELHQKIFAVDVRPSSYDAARLFEYLRDHLLDLMPSLIDSDPERSNPSRIEEGATLTMALPLRGNIQVRAAEVANGRITLLTMAGHPLAGAVRFATFDIDGGVHFEIVVHDRAANLVDWMLMRPVGDQLQDATWIRLAESVARVAGDPAPEVKRVTRDLDAAAAQTVDRWAKDLALRLQRKSHPGGATGSARRSPGDTDSERTIYRSDRPAPG
jgi:uncharacterized protein YbjT (DUF2867 family)